MEAMTMMVTATVMLNRRMIPPSRCDAFIMWP
jgi:hypothetical protein